MRIVFMGTPSYASVILKELLKDNSFEVVALVTQMDKPVGRRQILTPPDTKKFLLDNSLDIKIFQPETLKDETSIKFIKELKPDFIVVAAYGMLLPKEILSIAPCINLHASILPKYRGASPIQSAILNQDRFSGVSAMLMNEGLDTGDILSFSYIGISNLNAIELFEKLSRLAAKLTIKTLKNFNSLKPIKQIDCEATYAKKIKKEDGLVDLLDAKKVYAKYLAFIFWPGIFLKSGIKLKKIALHDIDTQNGIGKILKIEKEYIILGCKKGSLKIFSLQIPSKKQMSAVEYIRGKRLEVGDIIS